MTENTPTDLKPGEYRVEGHGAVVRVTSHNTFGSTFDVLSVVVLGYATYHVFFGNLR